MTARTRQAPERSGRFCLRAAARIALAGWRAFLRSLAAVKVPEDIVERIYRDRSIEVANMFRVLSAGGISTMLLWMFYFRDAPTRLFLDLMFGFGCTIYIIIFHQSHGWVHGGAGRRDPRRYFRQMLGLLALQGIVWGVLIIAMMRVATAPQTALVYAMIVAGMSTALLVSPSANAYAFWGPVAAGSVISLFVGAQPFNPFALVCLISYIGITGFAALYLNNRLTERAVGAIRVEENAELIKLLLRDFEENASDWLWETDERMQIRHVSPRLAQVAGKPEWALMGEFPEVLVGEVPPEQRRPGSALARLERCIAERAAFRDIVVPVKVRGEERRWQLTGKPVRDKFGVFIGYHGVGSDVTAVQRSQEQILFLAHHDSLTRLSNRVLFNEMLHSGCARSAETGLALLCLDLDDFKSVNDTMGHAVGDGLLVAVAERLRGCVRDGDVAARLGGDEFAIILNTGDIDEVTAIARRLIERIGRPYHFDGKMLEIGVSVGITMAPKDGDTPAVLMKNADLALYRAKADGRGTWRFYDLRMDERVKDLRSLQTDLRQALPRGEFYLHFQPIIDLTSKRIVCAEALLRWHHPVRGQLPPAEFIPLAETSGLIGPIGAWVLRQACATAARWPDSVHVAVNLSPLQFRDQGISADVGHALAESGLAPERLELEITETTLLETSAQNSQTLTELHRRGIRIALDDFGTGYSSLVYLRRFPFDKLKIDRSFVRDLGQDRDSAAITAAILGLARNLDLTVTAEGVETEEQARFLIEHGCTQAQGFLFHRPLSGEQMSELLGARPAPAAHDVQPAAG